MLAATKASADTLKRLAASTKEVTLMNVLSVELIKKPEIQLFNPNTLVAAAHDTCITLSTDL